MRSHLLKLKEYFYNDRFVILLFAFLGFVLYVNTFPNRMFWDDYDFILNNRFIKDWSFFPKFFSESIVAGSGLLSDYWRPALLFVFSLEWRLFGDWAAGWHFVNASFHVADAILLFFILSKILKKRWMPLFAALIFLAHPLQTEAVTYVNSLGDSLSVFFIFLGILFFLKYKFSGRPQFSSGYYWFSLGAYVFALMSKETAVIMPALIFLIDFLFLNPVLDLKEKFKSALKSIWPFIVIAGVYILLRATVLNFRNSFNLYDEENFFTSNFYFRLFTFFRILTVYFGLLFWPLNLHMERSVEVATFLFSPSVIFGAVIFFGLLAMAFAKFRRSPILSFGIFWFFIGLFPTSNVFVPINGLLYEHWLYLPLIGIFLVLVWLGTSFAEKYPGLAPKTAGLGIFTVFLVFLSVLTVDRNGNWRDPITFYEQTLKYAPDSYRVINNLGMAYADKGERENAEITYKKAIILDPSNAVAYHNLGNTYRETGKKDAAMENWQIAVKLDPKFVFSYRAMADTYLKDKDYQKAREVLEKYVEYDASKVETLVLLAQIALEEKNLTAALKYLERARELEPNNQFFQASADDIKSLLERQSQN